MEADDDFYFLNKAAASSPPRSGEIQESLRDFVNCAPNEPGVPSSNPVSSYETLPNETVLHCIREIKWVSRNRLTRNQFSVDGSLVFSNLHLFFVPHDAQLASLSLYPLPRVDFGLVRRLESCGNDAVSAVAKNDDSSNAEVASGWFGAGDTACAILIHTRDSLEPLRFEFSVKTSTTRSNALAALAQLCFPSSLHDVFAVQSSEVRLRDGKRRHSRRLPGKDEQPLLLYNALTDFSRMDLHLASHCKCNCHERLRGVAERVQRNVRADAGDMSMSVLVRASDKKEDSSTHWADDTAIRPRRRSFDGVESATLSTRHDDGGNVVVSESERAKAALACAQAQLLAAEAEESSNAERRRAAQSAVQTALAELDAAEAAEASVISESSAPSTVSALGRFVKGVAGGAWKALLGDSGEISPPIEAPSPPVTPGLNDNNSNGVELSSDAALILAEARARLLPCVACHGWRVSNVNEDYSFCASYPRLLIVPASLTDADLAAASKFRSKRRIPVLAWRCNRTSATLTRASQPLTGVFRQRNASDERLLQAIRLTNRTSGTLRIVDARPYQNAEAQSVRGGGYENLSYYPACTIEFCGIANIHSVRASYKSLLALCRQRVSRSKCPSKWLSLLEGTGWLDNLRSLLSAAVQVATYLYRGESVLLHCSDGWDRTPQVSSLAQVILDPHFRTARGFAELVEKEWLLAGHQFQSRLGHGTSSDSAEESPIFLQFLECVYNLTMQFPAAFEFTEDFLIGLLRGALGFRFSTFFANSQRDREILFAESGWSALKPRKLDSFWVVLLDQVNDCLSEKDLLDAECSFEVMHREESPASAKQPDRPWFNTSFRPSQSVIIPECGVDRLILWRKWWLPFGASSPVVEERDLLSDTSTVNGPSPLCDASVNDSSSHVVKRPIEYSRE